MNHRNHRKPRQTEPPAKVQNPYHFVSNENPADLEGIIAHNSKRKDLYSGSFQVELSFLTPFFTGSEAWVELKGRLKKKEENKEEKKHKDEHSLLMPLLYPAPDIKGKTKAEVAEMLSGDDKKWIISPSSLKGAYGNLIDKIASTSMKRVGSPEDTYYFRLPKPQAVKAGILFKQGNDWIIYPSDGESSSTVIFNNGKTDPINSIDQLKCSPVENQRYKQDFDRGGNRKTPKGLKAHPQGDKSTNNGYWVEATYNYEAPYKTVWMRVDPKLPASEYLTVPSNVIRIYKDSWKRKKPSDAPGLKEGMAIFYLTHEQDPKKVVSMSPNYRMKGTFLDSSTHLSQWEPGGTPRRRPFTGYDGSQNEAKILVSFSDNQKDDLPNHIWDKIHHIEGPIPLSDFKKKLKKALANQWDKYAELILSRLHYEQIKLGIRQRLFGYTYDEQCKATQSCQDEDYLESYAGRVHFNFAVWDKDTGTKTTSPMPLKILGSPKSSSYEHYLRPSDGKIQDFRLPTAHESNQSPTLAGRKHYLHQPKACQEPIYEKKPSNDRNAKENQNCTLLAYLKPEINEVNPFPKFRFTVRFYQLEAWEVGLLDFVLNLSGEVSTEDLIQGTNKPELLANKNILALKLGYARPLGFGSCLTQAKLIAKKETSFFQEKFNEKFKQWYGNSEDKWNAADHLKELHSLLLFRAHEDKDVSCDYPKKKWEIFRYHMQAHQQHMGQRMKDGNKAGKAALPKATEVWEKTVHIP